MANRDLQALAAWTAWHAGVLSQTSKIPPLSDIMPDDPRPRPRQTPEQQWAIALAWNARLGGQVATREGV